MIRGMKYDKIQTNGCANINFTFKQCSQFGAGESWLYFNAHCVQGHDVSALKCSITCIKCSTAPRLWGTWGLTDNASVMTQNIPNSKKTPRSSHSTYSRCELLQPQRPFFIFGLIPDFSQYVWKYLNFFFILVSYISLTYIHKLFLFADVSYVQYPQ